MTAHDGLKCLIREQDARRRASGHDVRLATYRRDNNGVSIDGLETGLPPVELTMVA